MKVIALHSHAEAWQRVIKHGFVGLKIYIVALKTYLHFNYFAIVIYLTQYY